jgi:phenylacetate-CoA ligase
MSSIYGFICEKTILPLADIATGRSIKKKLDFLEKSQFWTTKRLKEYQNKKLCETIRFAFEKVPHYKKVFGSLGLKPEDIKTTDDLAKLPLLDKNKIRKIGIESFLACKKDSLIKCETSGSTGLQGTVYLSKEAQSFTIAAELLFFKWAGFRLGKKHLQTGITPKRGLEKTVKDFLFKCDYFPAFDNSEKNLKRIIESITKKKITVLVGYASSLYYIAKAAEKNNKKIKLESIISLGETLHAHYRKKIETVFDCKATDTYGCCEGLMIAGQCKKQKYHVCMPLLFVEIVDGKGKRLPIGKQGKIVLTRLDLNPMPLIRYEIGDIGALAKKQNCDCGRGFEILESIHGRTTDIIETKNGHKLPVYFFIDAFEHEPKIKQYQASQKSKQKMTIKIVTTSDFTKEDLLRIKEKVRKGSHYDIETEIKILKKIPATKSGKFRFVISKLEKKES